MKTFVLGFLIFALVSQANAQKSTIDYLTSGKWYMESYIIEGEDQRIPKDEVKNNWMLFLPHNKTEGVKMGKSYFGSWEYNEDDKTVIVKEPGGIRKMRIKKINDKILKAEIVGHETTVTMIRLQQ